MKINGLARNLALLMLLLTASASIYWLNVRPYQENQLYAAIMGHPMALHSQALSSVLKLDADDLIYAQNAKLAVFDQVLTSAGKRQLTGLEADQKDRVYKLAGKLASASLKQQPGNYRIKYNAALLLASMGNLELAIKLLEELTQASPKRTAFWYTLAKARAANGDLAGALMARVTAKSLNPDGEP